jgi:hypothetical protein
MNEYAQLRKDVNKVLDSLDPHSFPLDAVNWGDLSCVAAGCREDNFGDWTRVVYIGEASPDCCDFRIAIAQALKQKWGNVEVITEW